MIWVLSIVVLTGDIVGVPANPDPCACREPMPCPKAEIYIFPPLSIVKDDSLSQASPSLAALLLCAISHHL